VRANGQTHSRGAAEGGPWTRFREEVEARLESTGEITPPHLGTLRSVRDEPAAALAESEPPVEEPGPVSPTEQPHRNITHPLSRSRETNLVRRDFFKTKGRPNHHDPASADDLPKYGRIRGCGGAGPGGSGQARQVFRPHHELPRDRRGAASASSARRAISHPQSNSECRAGNSSSRMSLR